MTQLSVMDLNKETKQDLKKILRDIPMSNLRDFFLEIKELLDSEGFIAQEYLDAAIDIAHKYGVIGTLLSNLEKVAEELYQEKDIAHKYGVTGTLLSNLEKVAEELYQEK